jgi:hypothetical protein
MAAIVMIAACSKETSSPVAPKTPTGSTGTLATGSIPATGGFITVSKAGDPLNGFTLALPGGAFPAALNVTITESSNASWPTASGIAPISPIAHIASNESGYSSLPIEIKMPAKVPANTFPVIVMYDSATHAVEPISTVAYDSVMVIGLTTHLNTANIQQVQGSAFRVHARQNGGGSAGLALGVYGIPLSVLNQDFDTGFRPGRNDWEFSVPGVQRVDSAVNILGGESFLAAWYFNTGASPIPLNNRFANLKNASLSDSLGIVWAAQLGHTSPLATTEMLAAWDKACNTVPDSLIGAGSNLLATVALIDQQQIRAGFALAVLNGGKPLPQLVAAPLLLNGDLATAGQHGFGTFVAYRASGSQIYISDPGATGDTTRVLSFPSGQPMTPYNPGQYVPTITVIDVSPFSLGLADPPGVVEQQYQQVLAGTIRNPALWPTVNYMSYFGRVYDTMFVVDTLRGWVQCPNCPYSISPSLSNLGPNQEVVPNAYQVALGDSVAVDSTTEFTSILVGPGGTGSDTVVEYAVVVSAADVPNQTSNFSLNWVDYHQFIRVALHLQVHTDTTTLVAGAAVTYSLSMYGASYLPAQVTYVWNFGDGTTVNATTPAAQQHTYSATGSYSFSVIMTDQRNNQVIGQVNRTNIVQAPTS